MHQTRKTVFDQISKHVENKTRSGVFLTNCKEIRVEMWSNTVLSAWYILSVETKNNEKIKK